MINIIRVEATQAITPEIVEYLIGQFKTRELSRLLKLEEYYRGKQEILKREMVDTTKPNNKCPNPYANYITDLFTGYFMGEAIGYTTTSEDDALAELKLVFAYNDEADENSELAKDASIYGKAYEMLYVDEGSATRFKKVNPKEVILIYDDTVESEMLFALRFYSGTNIMGENAYTMCEVYSKTDITIYKGNENYSSFKQVEVKTHKFGLVPFVEYKNNDDMIGDFELVIDLIDAYDKLLSDNLNDFEQFTDCYLGLYGMDAEPEDIKLMKENRVMLFPEAGSKAEFITKSVDDTQIENLKSRVESDIHKFSKCPSMTDKDFAGQSSGVAMKYKLMGMENVASVKERKFKKGIQRRIELIANIMSLLSTDFDYRSINLTFVRNIPVNVVEIAEMIAKLKDILSKQTLISQLPFIEDSAAELKLVEDEKEPVIVPKTVSIETPIDAPIETLAGTSATPVIA